MRGWPPGGCARCSTGGPTGRPCWPGSCPACPAGTRSCRARWPGPRPAAPAAGAAVLAACVMAARRVRAVAAAWREARCLPGDSDVVIVADPEPDAFALPGYPGRVVVTGGMLDALGTRERQALLAHERAHLACAHYLFVAAAHLAAAPNPLLRPLPRAVEYTAERWADEGAAAGTG